MDDDALRSFYDEHHSALDNICRRIASNDAPDLAQECWVKLLPCLRSGRHPAELKKKLYTIARHLWIDRLRRQKLELLDGDPPAAPESGPPERLSPELLRCLCRLSLVEQQCLQMSYLVGLTQERIAEVLGIEGPTTKASNVNNKLANARRTLRDCMNQRENR